MNDDYEATQRRGDLADHTPDARPSRLPSFTCHHATYERGQHWFSAELDGDEVGHAYVLERQGPGGPHAEIEELRTNPHYRGQGIGSQLLDNVAEHFKDCELRLKPYPIDENSGQDIDGLREFYRNRGFEDYQLSESDPFELHDYMTKHSSRGPAPEPAGSGEGEGLEATRSREISGERSQPGWLDAEPVYLHGGPNRVAPGDLIHQDAMPRSYGRLQHNFFTTSRQVAEDAADMRDGLGHGWIHTVVPTGPFEPDPGEMDSWKSRAPLRVVSVRPGRLNGTAPHAPILRQPKTAIADNLVAPASNRAPVVELVNSSFSSQTQARRLFMPASPDASRGRQGTSRQTRGRGR